MSRNKVLVILIVSFLIVTSLGVYFIINLDKKDDSNGTVSRKSSDSGACSLLDSGLKSGGNVILYLNSKFAVEISDEILKRLNEDYKQLQVYKVDEDDLNLSCYENLLKKNNLYGEVINNEVPVVIAYKDGSYKAIYIGVDEYENLEDFLAENKIIVKKKIVDNLTLTTFKQNIKKNKYVLTIVSSEKIRSQMDKNISEVFKGYDYDIVNFNSASGSDIYNYLKKDLLDDYPQTLYFEKGKLKGKTYETGKEYLEKFKNSVENK